MVENNTDVPAINKMNLIFNLLSSEPDGLSQFSICNKLNLSKATVSRLINTLCGMGYLEQRKKSSLYSLGIKLLYLGNIVYRKLDLNDLSVPIIEKLSNITEEMVKISVLRSEIVYPVNSCESKKAIRITLDSGTVFPPYIGASGKLLMAMTEEGKRYSKEILPNIKIEAYTEYTLTDLKILKRTITQIQDEKIAYDMQEESEGIYAMAAPVYNSNSEVIAAVSIPFFGNFQIKKDKYLPLLKLCANEISKSMGYVKGEGN